MKTILCYGDSNTWGDDPESGNRFSWSVRWPGVLQSQLNDGYRVIEEGLCGRTAIADDPKEWGRNGLQILPVILRSHAPLDLVILMLGTNDLKERASLSAEAIADGMSLLADCCRAHGVVNVLLVSPPVIQSGRARLSDICWKTAGATSRELAPLYRTVAEECGCEYFDAATVAEVGDCDGIHLTAAAHQRLGEALSQVVRRVLKRSTSDHSASGE